MSIDQNSVKLSALLQDYLHSHDWANGASISPEIQYLWNAKLPPDSSEALIFIPENVFESEA